MSILSKPTCTQCGSALPLGVLWRFARASDEHSPVHWLNRSGPFQTKVGVECPNCGAQYRVIQTRIHVIRLLSWGLLFAAAALIGSWLRRQGFKAGTEIQMVLFALVIACGFVLERFTPYFAQVRPVRDGENVGFPLYSVYERSKDDHAGNRNDI
jgi:hypothetical protein